MDRSVIRVGTRNSALAMAQTAMVVSEIKAIYPSLEIEIIEISTTGDFRRDKLNLQVQDKKQWIVELEKALIEKRIDFAVHSGKDVPLNLELGTNLLSVLTREDARDVIIIDKALDSEDNDLPLSFLKNGARIGTSSKRRKAQLLRIRPDLEILQCRGNVPTRVDKVLVYNEFDAVVLGKAGINRLSLDRGIAVPIEIGELVPAVCQGTLVCQFRSSDEQMIRILKDISDPATQLSFLGERAVIEGLNADCHSALGVYLSSSLNEVEILCRVCSEDGSEWLEASRKGPSEDINSIAKEVVDELIQGGARKYL